MKEYNEMVKDTDAFENEDFHVSDLLKDQNSPLDKAPGYVGQPDQIVILVDRKPIALDTILPFVFGLREENTTIPIIWLVKNKSYISDIKRNYVLWNGMKKTGKIEYLLDAGGSKQSIFWKLKSLFQIAIWIKRFLSSKTLFLNHGDFDSSPVNILAAFVRKGGGSLAGYSRACYPMSRSRVSSLLNNKIISMGSLGYRPKEAYGYVGDFWLIPHPLHGQYVRSMVSAPLVVIGTPRSYSSWGNYLTEVYEKDGVRDVKGESVSIGGDPVFVIFYPGNHDIPDLVSPTSCRDQLLNILNAITGVCPSCKIIIKPHTICDIDELERDLKKYNNGNIILSYTHPQILARIASAAFFTNSSNVMDDMYVANVPTVDAAEYKATFTTQFPNRSLIRATTSKELENAVLTILEKPEELISPDLSHLVWPKAKSLSACLWHTPKDSQKDTNT